MLGISMNKRAAGLVLAVVLAAVATFVLFAYIREMERQALAQADPVGVYVAKETIPSGTSGADAIEHGLIASEELPRKAIVEGAITHPDEIRDMVAAADILPGEQLVAGRFSPASENQPLLKIPEGHQALAVEVAMPPAVAGFVKPGDRVSVIATIGSGGQEAHTRYLVQAVEVLAVGSRTQTEGGDEGLLAQNDNRVTLTLALTAVDAERVTFAVSQGEIYFTLVPPDQPAQPSPGRGAGNLFS